MRWRFGLTVTVVALLVLAMLAAQVASYLSSRDLLELVVHGGQIDKVKVVGSALEILFKERTHRISDVARLVAGRGPVSREVASGRLPSELAAMLDRIAASSKLGALELIGPGKISLYRTDDEAGRAARFRGWGVDEALSGRPILATARDRAGMVAVALEPIRRDDKVLGAVAVGLRVNAAFLESLAAETASALVLFNRRGTVATSMAGVSIRVDTTAVNEAFFQKIPVFQTDQEARTATVYLPLLIVDEAHVLVAQVSSERAYAALGVTTRQSALTAAAILALSALVASSVVALLLRPLRRLRARAEQTAIDFTGNPIPPGRGGEIGSVVQVLDTLTDRLLARNRELAEASVRAQAASQAKSDFLSRMSHEIRTPLNGVLGMAELLQKTALDDTQRRYCRTIASSGRSLHELLSDILDLAKIEAGKLHVESVAMEPATLVTEIADAYRELASARGVVLAVELDPTVPGPVSGDPARLRQVLTNLLGNALKFTPQGGRITFGLRRLDPPPGPGRHWLRFTVRDTGIGMTPQTLGKLFTPFTQGDTSTTRTHGGTGLGLVICRGLAELMGGTLHLESAVGQGTTARVDLPFEGAPAADTGNQGGQEASRIAARVLVAEDNPVNQEVIASMLAEAGATVTIVDNGALAVRALEDGGFDMVLMDCQMPVMDGYQATAEIRAAEAGNRRVPIVALTANAFAEDRQRCLEAGMDDYISKPVTMDDLLRTVGRWAGGRRPARDGSLAPPAKAAER